MSAIESAVLSEAEARALSERLADVFRTCDVGGVFTRTRRLRRED